MRSRHFVIALAASLSLAACSDAPPTGANLTPFGQAPANLTLGQYIDQQIVASLPRGLATSAGARWSTVVKKKNAGDMAGAASHFNSLADWLIKKTSDFTPPAGATKGQASAQLVLAMATWLYDGPNAGPPAPPGPDVAIEIAPAGEEFLIQTPSEHAGISWGAGSTNEDRLIVLAQDPTPYPGVCTGPLVTRRCQYPLFYTAHSYPNLRLNVGHPGRFAICMVETGERRPLEYPEDETGARPIDDRMRLAHDLPSNPTYYTTGASQEDGIEVLPKAEQQSGELIDCDAPDKRAMGPLERALYVASRFVGKFLAPKTAYAWDSGPEHNFEAFSHFNGVDPESQPDLAVTAVVAPISGGDAGLALTYTITNATRRNGGDATGPAPDTKVGLFYSNDAVLDSEDVQIPANTGVPALGPDAAPHTGSVLLSPGNYSYVLVQVYQAGSEVSTANNFVAIPLGPVIR